MNILLMHHSVPPVIGGVESVLAHHARLMSAAGHAVTVVAARGEPVEGATRFVEMPLADSLHPRILAVKQELDEGRVPAEFYELVDELSAALRPVLRVADAVIPHNLCSLNKNLALTAALHRLYQEPGFPRLILWHHDLAWTTPRYLPELHDGFPWDLLRDDWSGALHVTVSALRRSELSDLTGVATEKIAVVPNGIDVEKFLKLEDRTVELVKRLNLLQAAPILLLPVRITPRKNVELALNTLAFLREDFPHATVLVTGPVGAHNPENADYLHGLLDLRHRLGLDSAAHFLAEEKAGPLPDSAVSDIYRLADALFLPSREEGFGIPLLEAGVNHRPVFCADLAALRELGGESVFYFSPDDNPKNVAALVARTLQNDPVYRMAAAIRRDFDWDRIYQKTIAPLLAGAARIAPDRGGTP
jgi:glycosyltransferase involved in cell wall biosynthesis